MYWTVSIPGTLCAFAWLVLQVEAYREKLKGLEHAEHSGANASNAASKASPDAMPVLLLWFLVFDFIFLYLSNTTYSLMRENFFKMVSYTVSIFCALLVEMAVVEILLEGLLRLGGMSEPHYDLAYLIFTLLLFPAWFIGISYSTWFVQDSSDSVVAAGGVIAHTAAFTGIDLSVRLQKILATKLDKVTGVTMSIYVVSPLLAMLVCKLFSNMSHWVRRKKLMDNVIQQKEGDGHGPFWAHEAFHGELECAAILSGWLFRQALLTVVQQRIPTKSGDIEVTLAGPVMFLTVGGFICAKSVLAALPWKNHLTTFVQLLLGMAACWCFMSFIMYDIKQNVDLPDHRWLFLLFSVSAVAITAMFVLGYMADWRMLQKDQLQELIAVCGIATGLAWEKSFEWAVKQVVKNDVLTYNRHAVNLLRHGSPLLADLTRQLKIFEVGAYLAILAVMVPAWRWYIVPLANHH